MAVLQQWGGGDLSPFFSLRISRGRLGHGWRGREEKNDAWSQIWAPSSIPSCYADGGGAARAAAVWAGGGNLFLLESRRFQWLRWLGGWQQHTGRGAQKGGVGGSFGLPT